MAHLILHIGSHKTGTTTLQHHFVANEEALRRRGVAWLRTPDDRGPKINANLLARVAGRGPDFRARLDDAMADRVLRPEAETCVASGENLFWLFEPGPVARLAELARARFDRITVVAYLRRQDLLALSHRRQVAHVRPLPAAGFYGLELRALPRWRPHFARYFDYHAKLEMWREAFGAPAMRARLFEPQALVGGDTAMDFFALTGLPLAPESPPERRNASGGPERTLLMLAAKRAGLGREALKTISRRADDSGRLAPSRAEAAAFLENVAESNERLARAWRLADGAPFAFSPSLEMHPETGTDTLDEAQARARIEALLGASLATADGEGDGRRAAAG